MSSSEETEKRAQLAIWQAAAVWQAVLRSLVLVQLGLVLACLAVPLLGADENPDSSSNSGTAKPIQTLTLLRAIPYYLAGDDESFGDVDTHPYSVPGGRTVTVVLLFVLLLLLVLAVVATIGLGGDVGGRAPAVLGTCTGVGLIVATVLLAAAQKWLSNGDLATPWQAGLLLPIGAGMWLLSLTRARRGWDELSA